MAKTIRNADYKYTRVGGKNKVVSSKVSTQKPWRLNNEQRTQLKMAKLNQSTAKSAISEVGKTIRSVGAQMAGTRAYQTAASSRIAEKAASSDSSKAIDLYNRIVNGNPNQEGESGEESTTTVGGSGSRIGG